MERVNVMERHRQPRISNLQLLLNFIHWSPCSVKLNSIEIVEIEFSERLKKKNVKYYTQKSIWADLQSLYIYSVNNFHG